MKKQDEVNLIQFEAEGKKFKLSFLYLNIN